MYNIIIMCFLYLGRTPINLGIDYLLSAGRHYRRRLMHVYVYECGPIKKGQTIIKRNFIILISEIIGMDIKWDRAGGCYGGGAGARPG